MIDAFRKLINTIFCKRLDFRFRIKIEIFGAAPVKSPSFLRKKAGTGRSSVTAVKPRFG